MALQIRFGTRRKNIPAVLGAHREDNSKKQKVLPPTSMPQFIYELSFDIELPELQVAIQIHSLYI